MLCYELPVLQYIITSKLVRHHHVANDTKKGEYGNGRRCVINMKNWGTFPLDNQINANT